MSQTDRNNSNLSKPDSSDEATLIERARSGDLEAVTTLMKSYQKRIFSVAYRMVGHYDDAADLTQEALIKVMTNLDKFDGRSALSTWIIRISMNLSLSHLRKERRRRETFRATGSAPTGPENGRHGIIDFALETAENAEPGGIRGVEQDEKTQLLSRCLEEIGDEYRALLVLRDVQGLEYKQVGEVLGLPIGTVKSRLFRARLAFRKTLDRHERSAETTAAEKKDAAHADQPAVGARNTEA